MSLPKDWHSYPKSATIIGFKYKNMRILKKILLIFAIALPTAVFAAPPSGVQNIETTISEGKVHVLWEALENEDIAYYRVYYSSKSILENEGFYDDFESTEDSEARYIFETLPPTATLFVSVLAVNQNGEESSAFIGESSIDISQMTAPIVPEPEEFSFEDPDFVDTPEPATEEIFMPPEDLPPVTQEPLPVPEMEALEAPIMMEAEEIFIDFEEDAKKAGAERNIDLFRYRSGGRKPL